MIALEGRQAAASARRIMQLLRSKSKFNVMCYIVLTMLASCARGDGAQCFNSMSKRTLRSAIAAAWSQPQLHLTRYPKSARRKESEFSDTKVCRHSDVPFWKQKLRKRSAKRRGQLSRRTSLLSCLLLHLSSGVFTCSLFTGHGHADLRPWVLARACTWLNVA